MKKKNCKLHYKMLSLFLCSLLFFGCGSEPVVTTDVPSDTTPRITQDTTATKAPEATTTEAPEITTTEAPDATTTEAPEITTTEAPDATATEAPVPTVTDTPVPTATEAPKPIATDTPDPTPTTAPKATPTTKPTAKPDDTYADTLKITVDKNGLASWKPVRNAVAYEYDVCIHYNDENISANLYGTTTDTSIQLSHRQFVTVTPVFSNGKESDSVNSDIYMQADVKTLSYPENLVDGSLVSKNGTLSFTLQTSDARKIRMVGHNCSLEKDGTIVIRPGGDLYTVDEVGNIQMFSTSLDGEDAYTYHFGYDFAKSTQINSWEDDMTYLSYWSNSSLQFTSSLLPNYLRYCPDEWDHTVRISSFFMEYTSGSTGLKSLTFDSSFFPEFLPGDPYAESLETSWDPENGIFDFYLLAVPDVPANATEDTEVIAGPSNYVTGDLKDANGKVVSKDDPLPEGGTLEVSIGDYTYDVPLVQTPYTGAKTFHELLPSVYPKATGDLNVLVVPICWADQKSHATKTNMDFLKSTLGIVLDKNGKATDYSVANDNQFSLSEYYNISSYGALNVQSFLTDWYYASDSYDDIRESMLEQETSTEITKWVKKTYPNLDWSLYDQDKNGLIDLVIFINTGDATGYDSFSPLSYGGAYSGYFSYTGEFAGTPKDPTVNNHLSTNLGMLYKDTVIGDTTDYFPNVLIHEFAHCLGLIDYYDVNYSGIDAIGGYDMQSSNYGDWNVYSKYGVGWLNPTVITEDSFNGKNSIDVTITSSALNNSALVIPAAGTSLDGSPFGEYIMVDLFTPEGVHEEDAAQFDLQDTVGVRMYHAHTKQVKRVLTGSDGKSYTIGTIQIGNNYAHMAKNYGMYHLELIQAGGDNTFTDLDNLNATVSANDFFQTGDTFTTENYSEFFYEGKMDNGQDFGYSIQVVSATEDGATIRITKQ